MKYRVCQGGSSLTLCVGHPPKILPSQILTTKNVGLNLTPKMLTPWVYGQFQNWHLLFLNPFRFTLYLCQFLSEMDAKTTFFMKCYNYIVITIQLVGLHTYPTKMVPSVYLINFIKFKILCLSTKLIINFVQIFISGSANGCHTIL